MSSWARISTRGLGITVLGLTAMPSQGADSRATAPDDPIDRKERWEPKGRADGGPAVPPGGDLAQVSVSVQRGGEVVAEPTVFTPIGTTRLIDEPFLGADGFEHARMALQITADEEVSGQYRAVFFYDATDRSRGRFEERLVKGVTKTIQHQAGGMQWDFIVHVHDGLAP